MKGWQAQFARHRFTGLLIDTNLLLLYAIGLHRTSLIERHKRTRQYTVDDFELVRGVAGDFPRIVTTSHILAELCNLAIPHDVSHPPYFKTLLDVILAAHELYVEKDAVVQSDAFPRLGFTDAAIIEIAKRERYLVLTDDFALHGYLVGLQRYAINLNHLRTGQWFGGT